MRTNDDVIDDESPNEDPALTEYNRLCEPVVRRSKKPIIVRDRKPKRINGYSGTRGYSWQQSGR